MFSVGDKIVYPMHGAGTIDSIEEKDILGEKQSYYILKMPSDVKVMIPTAKAEEVGVRNIIDKQSAEKVFKILGQDETEMDKNWNKRYRNNMDKMKSGDIYEVADVVRNLSFKQKEKGLSTGEKKMLNNAKQILVSELVLAEHANKDEVEEQIENKINTSFMTFRADSVEQESIVNKFIPFVSIYSSFLQRGYDQVLHDIARMNSHVIIGVDRCGLVGTDGSTHQGVFDVSFLLPIPKLIISVPKDSVESASLLNTAIKTNSPFIIRYSKKRIEYKEEKITSIQVGSWEKITDGLDATLITYGDFVNESISVIDKLKSDGYNVSLVNARFLKPIDFQMFNEITKKNKPIFVYEESMQIGGLGSYLSSITDKEIITYAIKDEFVNEGTREELLEYLGLDTDTIYNKIKEVITSARVRK